MISSEIIVGEVLEQNQSDIEETSPGERPCQIISEVQTCPQNLEEATETKLQARNLGWGMWIVGILISLTTSYLANRAMDAVFGKDK